HAMEFVQADALARFHRLKGDDVFFMTGTDEHGTKLVQAAEKAGKTPQRLADENAVLFEDICKLLTVDYDYFIRTSNEDHMRGAQKLWKKLVEAGDIYKDTYEGLYCVGCEAFVLEKDLASGKCPNHNKEPEILKEENYFFRLSKYSEQIGDLIKSDKLKIVPDSRKHEILQVIKDGLRDVSFSRPRSVLNWGVDVPDDPDQVMYVWCDALSNYITGVDYENEGEQFKKYWPADVHVIGKDILRFHAAIWIGMLLSAKLYLPKRIYVHGFVTCEGKKMSKTLGNVVDPVEYAQKYGTDALRYYLLREIPTTEDGDFSQDRFEILYGSELANNIGNLVSRVLAMTGKYFDGKVPRAGEGYELLAQQVDETWVSYEKAIGDFDLKKALERTAQLADLANKYVEDTKPWVLAKDQPEKLAEVMYNLLEMIRHIAYLLLPFLPAASAKILDYLGLMDAKPGYEKIKSWGILKAGSQTTKAEPLFARIESE
ncbi:methionine--tRNA ligase, partial [Patescibacteria group bacterium]|nr:methionine--tRNA ligase [Patescibacteria group bacterium]